MSIRVLPKYLAKRINKHYLEGFVPLLIVVLIFFAVKAPVGLILAFALGHCWPLAFETPGIKRKMVADKYRFSTFKMLFAMNQWVKKLLKKEGQKKWLAPLIVPSLFILLLVLISAEWSLLSGFLGMGFYLLVKHFLIPKVRKKLLTK